jgi:hypothetical protein
MMVSLIQLQMDGGFGSSVLMVGTYMIPGPTMDPTKSLTTMPLSRLLTELGKIRTVIYMIRHYRSSSLQVGKFIPWGSSSPSSCSSRYCFVYRRGDITRKTIKAIMHGNKD